MLAVRRRPGRWWDRRCSPTRPRASDPPIVFRLRPDEAHNDASRLLRSLYDHVVTFAWLGADPPPRLALWRKEDLEERLKIHREFAAAGEQLIRDADREQMERDIARLEGKAPDLASKAAMADKHYRSPATGHRFVEVRELP